MRFYQLKASELHEDFHDLIGTDITFACEIISIGGMIMHTKGEKAFISDVIYTAGHYLRSCPDIYEPAKISSFQINGITGHWYPETFEEFKHLKKPKL